MRLKTMATVAVLTVGAAGALGVLWPYVAGAGKPSAAVPPRPAALAVGKPAPDFRLQTSQGRWVRLSAFRGQPVLLNFWATWCTACQGELSLLQQLSVENGAHIAVVGVDVQQLSGLVNLYRQQHHLTYPTVLDLQGTVTAEYNVTGLPTSVFINARGIVTVIHVGAYHSLAEMAPDVAAAEAPS